MKPQPLNLEGIKNRKFIEDYAREILKEVKNIQETTLNKDIFAHGIIFVFIRELIDDIEQRLKSACEFWLRYKDNPKLFSEEQFKIRWEYYSDLGYLVWNMNRKQWENYNEWLFRLAFKDVFEVEKK